MQTFGKTLLGLSLLSLLSLTAAGALVLVDRDPPPPPPAGDLVAPELDDSGGVLDPEAYTAFFCCPPDGGACSDVTDDLTQCPPSNKLVSCGCPASQPDGTVSCGC